MKPRIENLTNPQFITGNGCAEHYPIWKSPSLIGGRLAELINGSMGGERDASRGGMKSISYYQNESNSLKGTFKEPKTVIKNVKKNVVPMIIIRVFFIIDKKSLGPYSNLSRETRQDLVIGTNLNGQRNESIELQIQNEGNGYATNSTQVRFRKNESAPASKDGVRIGASRKIKLYE